MARTNDRPFEPASLSRPSGPLRLAEPRVSSALYGLGVNNQLPMIEIHETILIIFQN